MATTNVVALIYCVPPIVTFKLVDDDTVPAKVSVIDGSLKVADVELGKPNPPGTENVKVSIIVPFT